MSSFITFALRRVREGQHRQVNSLGAPRPLPTDVAVRVTGRIGPESNPPFVILNSNFRIPNLGLPLEDATPPTVTYAWDVGARVMAPALATELGATISITGGDGSLPAAMTLIAGVCLCLFLAAAATPTNTVTYALDIRLRVMAPALATEHGAVAIPVSTGFGFPAATVVIGVLFCIVAAVFRRYFAI